jgi:acetoin utilization deacetylase AcuC-like enzyme
MVRETARKTNAWFFALLEGGYNHRVLGHNCMALLEGMREVGEVQEVKEV